MDRKSKSKRRIRKLKKVTNGEKTIVREVEPISNVQPQLTETKSKSKKKLRRKSKRLKIPKQVSVNRLQYSKTDPCIIHLMM